MSGISSVGLETRSGALRDLLVAAPAAPMLTAGIAISLGRSPGIAAAALAVYALVGILILQRLPRQLPGSGLGAANRVTLGRVLVGTPIVAFLLFPGTLGSGARWWIVALATLALVLDGLDGWVARRTGTVTRFGARFDMETDAALLLVLSILAWRVGPAGAWVIGIGALRYLFVLAGAFVPRLRGDLPRDQLRRKTICVVQALTLGLILVPMVPPTLAWWSAAGALMLLSWSFAVDTDWLLRHGQAPVA